MIRQAVSCDICGAEKKQTNHWFVAYEQSEELRLCGWNSRFRKRPGSMHLCGQKCLHKLVDDFMARQVAARALPAEAETAAAATRPTDTSLTARARYPEPGPAAEFAVPALPALQARAERVARMERVPAELAVLPERTEAAETAPLFDEPPRDAARRLRDAWERERERQMRATQHRSGVAARHGA